MPRQRFAALGLQPAEATAFNDGGIRRLTEIGQIRIRNLVGEFHSQFMGEAHGHCAIHGTHFRKLARIRNPTGPLFSTWN